MVVPIVSIKRAEVLIFPPTDGAFHDFVKCSFRAEPFRTNGRAGVSVPSRAEHRQNSPPCHARGILEIACLKNHQHHNSYGFVFVCLDCAFPDRLGAWVMLDQRRGSSERCSSSESEADQSEEGSQERSDDPPTVLWRRRMESSNLQLSSKLDAVARALDTQARALDTLQQGIAAIKNAQSVAQDQLDPKDVRRYVAYYLFTQYPKPATIKVRSFRCLHDLAYFVALCHLKFFRAARKRLPQSNASDLWATSNCLQS